MTNFFTADFSEIVEMNFGTSVKNAFRRAIDLEFSFADMARLVALYRRESDPFLDVEDFVSRASEIGVAKIMDELKEISDRMGLFSEEEKREW